MSHERLLTAEGGGMHLVAATASDLDQFHLTLTYEHPGLVVRRIRSAVANTWAGLFDELAAALQFPSYFGGNWSAALDCLSTMDASPGSGYVLLFADANRVLYKEPPEALNDLVDLVTMAHDYWQAQGKPFHVVFHAAAGADELAARLSAVGVVVDRDWSAEEVGRPPQEP